MMSHISKGDVHAYLDGALVAYPEEAARHVREHLDACLTCAQLLEGERRLRQEASAILSASAQGPVEFDPLEELLARAVESDRQEPAEGAEGSERTGRARPLVGSRLSSLRWAATIVVSLGAGWMARELIGPAGDLARGAASERVVTEIGLPPAADQERMERDNPGEFAETETLPESKVAVAGGLADANVPRESRVAAVRGLAQADSPPELQDAVAGGGVGPGANQAAVGFDDDLALDQIEVEARQREEAVARRVEPAAASVRAQAAELQVEAARLSDELRGSALSSPAAAEDRRDGASPFDNAPPEPSAASSPSTTPFLVPGLPVRDVRLAPEADGLAGASSGSVVVTQELGDGRIIELQFVPRAEGDPVLGGSLQERNEFLGRTRQAGWGMAVRDVPGGVAVLSGPLTERELEVLLDRALGPR
jgi:hypothetical protein